MIAIRRMTPADLDFAMAVKQVAGWNQTEADWLAHLDLDPAGCLVAEIAGEPAGTAVVTNYGNRFGWIGMVLVHPRHRREGAGTALLTAACDYARDAGIHRVRLDATPAGREVYLRLGFTDEYALTRYRGVANAVAANGSARPVDPADDALVRSIVDWDAARFGTRRDPVLRELVTRAGSRTYCVHSGGSVAGYAVTRAGADAVQLGPWLAEDDQVAEDLLRAALAGMRGTHVIVDVPGPNTHATTLVTRYGLAVERPFTRMSRPAGTTPERLAPIYATAGADRG